MVQKRRWEAGMKVDTLVLVRKFPEERNGKTIYQWVCQCTECGREVVRKAMTLYQNYGKCDCQWGTHKRGSDHHNWNGVGTMPGHYFSMLKHHAKVRELPFEVSKDYVWGLFVQQDQRCALTGIPLIFAVRRDNDENAAKQTASLDRIDSLGGYVEGNVWWVHKEINLMKMDFPVDRFVELCRMVVEFYGDKVGENGKKEGDLDGEKAYRLE